MTRTPAPAAEPAAEAPTHVAEPAPAQWTPVAKTSKGTVHGFLLAIALAFLAISLGVAYYSANAIVGFWFEPQWVPVARLPLALGVAGGAAWALYRLMHRAA